MNTWRTRAMSITAALGCLAAITVMAQGNQTQRTPLEMEQKKGPQQQMTLPARAPGFPRVAVTTKSLNIRSAPSSSAPILGVLEKGREVSVLGMTGGYARIGEGMYIWDVDLKFK